MQESLKNESIYVIGFPKSGNTWLTRLLADSLKMRVGIGMNGLDKDEIATDVNTRLNLPFNTIYTIRKTHFLPNQLKKFRGEDVKKGVYIYRDIRDIIVSSYFYKNKKEKFNKKKFIIYTKNFIEHGWRNIGIWSNHMYKWEKYAKTSNANITFISYELLLKDTITQIKRIINSIKLEIPKDIHLKESVERQSFTSIKKYMNNLEKDSIPFGKEFNIQFLRKGISGDWEHFFDEKLKKQVSDKYGKLLIEKGYKI